MPEDRYTHGHHDCVLESHRARTAVNSAKYLWSNLVSGDRLLDVGCGRGTLTADLAELVAPGEVVAIDREPSILDEVREIVSARELENVTAEVGDVYSLGYQNDAFDAVHAHQVLQHLSDPVSALREMRRVTRRGGLVAARDADYGAMTWYPGSKHLDRWIEIYGAVARSNRADPDAGRSLRAWAHKAGFSRVVPSASVWCYADVESREWWSKVWAGRVTQSSVADQAVAHGVSTRDELADIANGFRTWADDPDSWFAVLHGEILATT